MLEEKKTQYFLALALLNTAKSSSTGQKCTKVIFHPLPLQQAPLPSYQVTLWQFTGIRSYSRCIRVKPRWEQLLHFPSSSRCIQGILNFAYIKNSAGSFVLDVKHERMIGVEIALFYLISNLYLCIKKRKCKCNQRKRNADNIFLIM